MALQVWLPLNGNLNNQGLSSVTVTNNGATVDNAGKIGKCYKFTTSQYMSLPYTGLSNASISFWIKLPASKTTWLPFSNNASKWIMACDGGGNFYCSSDVTGAKTIYLDGNIATRPATDGNWHHYCITDVNFTGWSAFYINRYNSASYNWDGYLNDFRIYDHCLSPKEVKEISKGLVLHYKLDENMQVMNNCFAYPTFDTSNSTGGWSHWTTSNNTGSYSQTTNKDYIWNANNAYAHLVTHLTGSYGYIVYEGPAFDGGYRSAQAIIKMADGSIPTTSKVFWDWNSNVGTKPPTTFTPLSRGFYLMKCEGFRQDGSNDLVCIHLKNQASVYISEAYLENDRTVCSDFLYQNPTTVYDCSGYGRNGTITSAPTIDNATPRYSKCMKFVDSATSITIGNLSTMVPDGTFTFNCWFKKKTDEWSSKRYETIFGGPSGFELEAKRGSTNSPELVMWNWAKSSGVVYTLDEWHMVTFRRTPSATQLYLDGVLKVNGTAGSIPSGDYFIGAWRTATEQNYRGYLSDARIYSTVLSADDIKELYNTSAIIYNDGTVAAREFSEGTNNIAAGAETARINKTFADGLIRYAQAHCQCTFTDDGFRIYRTPNLVYPDAGTVMWGGFVLDNTDNRFNFQTGHTYMIQFEIKGQTSNAPDTYWTNYVGWGGGELYPHPSNVMTANPVTSNYNNSEWRTFTYKWTINDDVWKTCTESYQLFVAGQTYVTYKGFKYGFSYTSTGALGTDLYIKNIRMYDITNQVQTDITKTGIIDTNSLTEEVLPAEITMGGIVGREIIEI